MKLVLVYIFTEEIRHLGDYSEKGGSVSIMSLEHEAPVIKLFNASFGILMFVRLSLSRKIVQFVLKQNCQTLDPLYLTQNLTHFKTTSFVIHEYHNINNNIRVFELRIIFQILLGII